MSKKGVIVIIEDDEDDKDILEMIVRDLGYTNPFKCFKYASDAWDFLKISREPTFVIFCDINLPRMTGLEFKNDLDKDPELRKKSIPFIFFSSSANQADVDRAYTEMTIQGYFIKESKYEDIRKMVKVILEYWSTCEHPNSD